jgi:hypothetical protein
MLAGEGHIVVHSTRHSAIEFGKDVISIAPDGVPCAFQLKGNPGGRLTLGQLREIRPQLLELITQPIVHPGISQSVSHRGYLVTNGEADEEVHRSLDDTNRELERLGFGTNRIELWQRGRLLEMANRLGGRLWPSEIEDLNLLLELLVHDGTDVLPITKFHPLLCRVFLLPGAEGKDPTQEELRRRATSAALLTAVSLRSFSVAENHFAVISAWTMYVAYWAAACSKYKFTTNKRDQAYIDIAKSAIFDSLAALFENLQKNERLISTGTSIVEIHRGRATLMFALMSLYWFWCQESGWPTQQQKDFLANWLPRDFSRSFIWGEGAIPQLLSHYWYISRTDATSAPETLLVALLHAVVQRSVQEQVLASPYFSFEEVMQHAFSRFLLIKDDPLEDESPHMISYFARGLMHLFVRLNKKRSCAMLWPDFTRLGLVHFEPDEAWQYSLWRLQTGYELTHQTPIPGTWSDLVEEARDCRIRKVPPLLLREPLVLLAFVILFPHRATPEVIRFLGKKFGTVWFIPPPVES